MILRQYLHVDPVAASYLFGCGGRSMAAVVDPVGDIGPYMDAAGKTYTPITFRPAARWPKQPMLSMCCSAIQMSRSLFTESARVTSWSWVTLRSG